MKGQLYGSYPEAAERVWCHHWLATSNAVFFSHTCSWVFSVRGSITLLKCTVYSLVMPVQRAPPASHSWLWCADVTSVMWPWPSPTQRLVPESVLHTNTRTHTELQSCCWTASELSKVISFTFTAPPLPFSSIYHRSLHHSFSLSTLQPLQSSPPHIYNKSIPLFASWGVCLSMWLSEVAWYFAAEPQWIINSQLSRWMKGADTVCACTHFPLVLQGEGAWWELLAEFWVTHKHELMSFTFGLSQDSCLSVSTFYANANGLLARLSPSN